MDNNSKYDVKLKFNINNLNEVKLWKLVQETD